jgi:hypothetical protein
MTKHSVTNLVEIEKLLSSIETRKFTVINYIWTEYGFYPHLMDELFRDFFGDVQTKGPIIGFCFPGQEIFYEPHVDILVTLKGFIDTEKAYVGGQETKELLRSFEIYNDRGIAFWFTVRNFDEDAYKLILQKFKFRNILFPIGGLTPWELGFPPKPGFHFASGIDGEWYTPDSEYAKSKVKIYSQNNVKRELILSSRTKELPSSYNVFFVKNSFKTRNYASPYVDDVLVGKDGLRGNVGFGAIAEDLYLKILNFHIENNLNLVIIDDLVPFPRIDSRYISYIQFRNYLEVRELLYIIKNSNNFINSGASVSDLAAYYLSCNQIVVGSESVHNQTVLLGAHLKKQGKKLFRFQYDKTRYKKLFRFLSKNSHR